jgi:hypothetical protein
MNRIPLLLIALLAAAGTPARSQTVAPPTSGTTAKLNSHNASDAGATIPALDYRSPFTAYQADKPQEPQSWRAVNDRVGAIGGWRVYAREAQPPIPDLPPNSPSVGKPPPSVR